MRAKRILAGVLLIFMFIPYLVPVTTAYADSNDRRKALISLAGGASLVDVGASSNIDEGSLRTIALYLSNFYIPFSTILDDDYESEEGKNSAFRRSMYTALTVNCGFDATTADFLIDYTLQQSLNSCRKLLVKKKDLQNLWTAVYDCKLEFYETLTDDITGSADMSNSAEHYYHFGFSGAGHTKFNYYYDYDKKFEEKVPTVFPSKIFGTSSKNSSMNASSIRYKDFESYCKLAGTVADKSGNEYVCVTYPVFLSIMNFCYEIASSDVFNFCSQSNLSTYSTYSIANRTKTNNIKDNTQYDGEAGVDRVFLGSNMTKDINVLNFYWMNDGGVPIACFSSSEECLNSLLMCYDSLYLNEGYGSAFTVLQDNDIKGISSKKIAIDGTVLGAKMYVNWVGDLVLDNGVYRTVVLPGCCNPHMLTTVEGSTNTIPMQNTFALAHISTGKLVEELFELVDGCTDRNYRLYVRSDANSLIKNKYFTEGIGISGYNFDDSIWSGWGDYEDLRVVLNDCDEIITNGAVGDDIVIFPSLGNIGSSITYGNFGNSDVAAGCVSGPSGRNRLPLTKTLDGHTYRVLGYRMRTQLAHTWHCKGGITCSNPDESMDCEGHVEYLDLSTLGYGLPVWNTSFTTYDNFSSTTNDSNLSDMFITYNIFDALKSNTVNWNTASFNNVRDYGVTREFTADVKSTFQSLFTTYCFAYFNKDYYVYSQEKNIVDLKMNVSSFPPHAENIDWSSLYTDALADKTLSFVYLLLHPTEGKGYFKTWLKNKCSSFLLGIHEDIVGSSDSNSTTGMTKYLGFSGYTTMPNLYDIEWVAWLLNNYNSIIAYLLIFITVVLLCYVITGSMTKQRGAVGLIMFTILAFAPPVAINTVVNAANDISSEVYTSMFDYCAFCQLQQFLLDMETLDDLKNTNDLAGYASYIMNYNTNASSESSLGGASKTYYSGVKVKWMSPKKYNTMSQVSSQLDSLVSSGDGIFLKNMLVESLGSTTSGESYVDNENALYLYRDYTDIYRYGSTAHNLYTTFNFSNDLGLSSATAGARDLTSVCAGLNIGYHDVDFNSVVNFSERLNKIKSKSGVGLGDAVANNSRLTFTRALQLPINNVLTEVSSMKAVDRGFLTSPYVNISNVKNYFASEGTLASSLLLNYNDVVYELAEKKDRLSRLIETKGEENAIDLSFLALTGDVSDFNLGLSPTYFQQSVQTFQGFKDVSLGRKGSTLFNDNYFGTPAASSAYKGYAKYKPHEIYRNLIMNCFDYDAIDSARNDLSQYYFALYSESPFYYFNFNIRDQVSSLTDYEYNYENLSSSGNQYVTNMFLLDNQSYFYNLTENSGTGYGELRDFMNMHDLFYYVLPCLKPGVETARMFDDTFGLYTDKDCSLYFTDDGGFMYSNKKYSGETESALLRSFYNVWWNMNEEERYDFWHSYNVHTILQGYTAWLDTMMDCDYAKPETITVLEEKFTVDDPLDPYSYFEMSEDKTDIIAGRYMVFSRSEMKYYGLDWADLTTVEQKIITIQDNVYAATLDLMNYYTMSEEVLMNAYAMIQLFEFNKEFSQNKLTGTSYIMYPQTYELKAFSYDAYLRMIVSESSDEDLMTSSVDGSSNKSIYERIMDNTSIFFGVFLVSNDVLAVYVVPILKLFIIVILFILSIMLIVGAAVKMELNFAKIIWKSIFKPLLMFAGINIGLSFLVSLFMGTGATGVTNTDITINVGDPTAVVIVMLAFNVIATVLLFKIALACIKDFREYAKAVFDNIGASVVGAFSTMAGVLSGRRQRRNTARIAKNTAKQAKLAKKNTGKRLAVFGSLFGAKAIADSISDNNEEVGTKRIDSIIDKNTERAEDLKRLPKDKALEVERDAVARNREIKTKARAERRQASVDKIKGKMDNLRKSSAENKYRRKHKHEFGIKNTSEEIARLDDTISAYKSTNTHGMSDRAKKNVNRRIDSMQKKRTKLVSKRNQHELKYKEQREKVISKAADAEISGLDKEYARKRTDLYADALHHTGKLFTDVDETVVDDKAYKVKKGTPSEAVKNIGSSVKDSATHLYSSANKKYKSVKQDISSTRNNLALQKKAKNDFYRTVDSKLGDKDYSSVGDNALSRSKELVNRDVTRLNANRVNKARASYDAELSEMSDRFSSLGTNNSGVSKVSDSDDFLNS